MACRGCLVCLLKLLNFLLTLVGLAMVGYVIYLFVEYKRSSSDTVGVDEGLTQFGRPLLMTVSADSIFYDLPEAWFIYLFIAVGVILFVISCFGCIGIAKRNVCCLTCYSVLIILLISVELGCAAFIYFDKSWEEKIPTDKTGDFTMIYIFLKEHWTIVRWVALGVIVLEVLVFFLAPMVRASNRPAQRPQIRQPLINRSPPATRVPAARTLDWRPSRNDAWSTLMREKISLDPLPTVNKAYYLVHQIEQQKQFAGNSVYIDESSAFVSRAKSRSQKEKFKKGRTNTRVTCSHCHRSGHQIQNCFEIIGYPDWYKGAKGKKSSTFAAHVENCDIPSGQQCAISSDPLSIKPGTHEKQVGSSASMTKLCQEEVKMLKSTGDDALPSHWLNFADKGGKDVPSWYLQSDSELGEVLSLQSLQIPVIDMSKLNGNQSQHDAELKKLHLACKKWGFFQLINHRVPEQIIQQMKTNIGEFFKLPLHEKKAYAQPPNTLEGYEQAFVLLEEQKLNWGDMLFLYPQPPLRRNMRYWPKKPASFSATLDVYSSELMKLCISLLRLMATNLKLEPCKLVSMFEEGIQGIRMNYYPECPRAKNVFGLSPHLDSTALTLLLQANDVDGLQIRKDNEWVPIKPIPGAFIVNIGDIMEKITNGEYKSIEHRAVVNPEKERLSMAAFHSPKMEAMIGPLPEFTVKKAARYNTLSHVDLKSSSMYKP